jgi:hypothetical protein
MFFLQEKLMRYTEIEDYLYAEVKRRKSLYEIAKTEFRRICTDVPSGLPQPDGTQRIHNAARDHRASREAFQTALNRFNDFILRRKIPDDLEDKEQAAAFD